MLCGKESWSLYFYAFLTLLLEICIHSWVCWYQHGCHYHRIIQCGLLCCSLEVCLLICFCQIIHFSFDLTHRMKFSKTLIRKATRNFLNLTRKRFKMEKVNITCQPFLLKLAIRSVQWLGIVAYEQFVFYTYLIHGRFR